MPSVRPSSVQVAFLPSIVIVSVCAHSSSRTKSQLLQDLSYLSVYSCGFIGITIAFSNSVPQTEHFLLSLNPVCVQVASYPAVVVGVCSFAGILIWATMISPQDEHFAPSLNPLAVQVGVTALSTSVSVC